MPRHRLDGPGRCEVRTALAISSTSSSTRTPWRCRRGVVGVKKGFPIHPTSFTVQEAYTPQHVATRGTIPPEFLDLVTTKKPFANLATVMPGSPQVTPVWFDFDGKYIRIVGTR